MPMLSQEQIKLLEEAMNAYLKAPPGQNGKTPVECEEESDQKRATVIEEELKPLLQGYLSGDIPLSEFKSRVDGINKRNNIWGFKGIKGQMFFNMVVNVSDDEKECDAEIKAAITIPSNEDIASSRIKTFSSYVRRIGDQYVEAGGSGHGKPKLGSIPFFLSYFWQIQDWETWPLYYTNTVNSLSDLNLWQPSGDLAEDYILFKHTFEEIATGLSRSLERPISSYDIEHMFWFRTGNPIDGYLPPEGTPIGEVGPGLLVPEQEATGRLPDSYVPPIVAVLPKMARGEERLIEAAKASGTSLERAFEKSIDAAFTILGYETKLLGQGRGRVPDGIAIDRDNSYVILWDAKVRTSGYSMGTDDRVIRDYVDRQSRDLKRKGHFRNIYYLIISSGFTDDHDEGISLLKMDTDVNEVCLVEAGALVAMVDARLRSPHNVTLGPDGIQRLFSVSGVVSLDTVRGILM